MIIFLFFNRSTSVSFIISRKTTTFKRRRWFIESNRGCWLFSVNGLFINNKTNFINSIFHTRSNWSNHEILLFPFNWIFCILYFHLFFIRLLFNLLLWKLLKIIFSLCLKNRDSIFQQFIKYVKKWAYYLSSILFIHSHLSNQFNQSKHFQVILTYYLLLIILIILCTKNTIKMNMQINTTQITFFIQLVRSNR